MTPLTEKPLLVVPPKETHEKSAVVVLVDDVLCVEVGLAAEEILGAEVVLGTEEEEVLGAGAVPVPDKTETWALAESGTPA
jgi:hypothetical protein